VPADLDGVIRSENFDLAKVLKVKRDALKARGLPPMPKALPPMPNPNSQALSYSVGYGATPSESSGKNRAPWEIQGIGNGVQQADPAVQDEVSQASTQVSYLLSANNEQQPNNGRTECGDIGFLFSVWTHNPVHTPTPDGMHR